MLTTILIIVAVVIAAILIYAAMKPDSFAVQRTARINAPAEQIFPLINDLKRFTTWSPFEKDPAMKRTFTGAETGRGQVYAFDGNRNVGAGDVSIVDTVQNQKIAMRLRMTRPFACDNSVVFTLQPSGSATDVTWAMSGEQPYMAKLMSTFINCDKVVGGQFEQGFGKLKALVER